jgi:Fe-S-cluster containining protein
MNANSKKVKVELKLSVAGEPLNFSVDVPAGKTTSERMLPVFRSVCGTIVRSAVQGIESEGRKVSCSAGCGACCRQLVPISETEAVMLKELVASMPADRRETITQRFSDATTKLSRYGLLDRLSSPDQVSGEEYHALALDYFKLGIPCPFLEDESCSIHPDRPLICREYVVVSPPENCSRLNGLPVEAVAIPLSAAKALQKMGDSGNWVCLTLSLDQRAMKAEPLVGTKIATRFFSKLLRKDLEGK